VQQNVANWQNEKQSTLAFYAKQIVVKISGFIAQCSTGALSLLVFNINWIAVEFRVN